MPVVTCPSCGTKLKAPDGAAGRRFACPKCKAAVTVPAADDSRAVAVPASAPPPAPAATKPCPFCSEPVIATARKCKHCGETLDVALRAVQEAERARRPARRRDEDDFDDDQPRRSAPPAAAAAAASTTVIVQSGEKASFPHTLHFILTVLTCGLWGPIWLMHAMFRAR